MPGLVASSDEEVDAALRALADANRRRILASVRERPLAVGEIVERVALTQQTVSFHLRVLRSAGLVTERRDRTRHLFSVRSEGLAAVREYLDGFWPTHLLALKRAAEAEAARRREENQGTSMVDYATSIEIDAPPDIVFAHLTDAERMVTWMGEYAELLPEPGGRFAVEINGVSVRGEYLTVEPPHRVVVSWGMVGVDDLPPGASRVEFVLTPTPGGTSLTISHTGLPAARRHSHAAGWGNYLGRLRRVAAGNDPGPDIWRPVTSAPVAAP